MRYRCTYASSLLCYQFSARSFGFWVVLDPLTQNRSLAVHVLGLNSKNHPLEFEIGLPALYFEKDVQEAEPDFRGTKADYRCFYQLQILKEWQLHDFEQNYIVIDEEATGR